MLDNLVLFCSSTGDGGELCFLLYQKEFSSLIMLIITQALYPLFPEFVEVILLPLDEFQTKIDGEASAFSVKLVFRSSQRHQQTLGLFCFVFPRRPAEERKNRGGH